MSESIVPRIPTDDEVIAGKYDTDQFLFTLHELDRKRERVEELEQENAALRRAMSAVKSLINESTGVAGLHLNGEVAPWDELRAAGRFEEWLVDFDTALGEAK